jgi:BirA family transcriptional regulator, biotin operon repressor / biotin---[acetyl-CoA-carboxylase] ligase
MAEEWKSSSTKSNPGRPEPTELLMAMSDSVFDLDRILRETFISAIDYHASIASTNSRGLELVSNETLGRPLLILANEQSAGRGRGSNQWWSATGALTFSVLLENVTLSIPQQKTPLVSLFTGLAVADALSAKIPSLDLQLKWPNDVYFEGRKLCGILIETSSRRAGAIVIGIGVNINNSVQDAPQQLRNSATALIDMTGRAWDRTEVLIAILQSLAVRLESIDQHDNLADVWRERCYLEGKTVQLEMGSRRITGVCQGIDNQGALLLQTEEKLERCFGGVVVSAT